MSNELAQRAVACPGWRWLPGMRTLKHGRVIEGNGIAVIDRDGALVAPALNRKWSVPAQTVSAVPDLDDPATLGCLLALVREAWGDQTLAVRFDDEYGWWVVDGNRWAECGRGDSEAEALVAALEAAP